MKILFDKSDLSFDIDNIRKKKNIITRYKKKDIGEESRRKIKKDIGKESRRKIRNKIIRLVRANRRKKIK